MSLGEEKHNALEYSKAFLRLGALHRFLHQVRFRAAGRLNDISVSTLGFGLKARQG